MLNVDRERNVGTVELFWQRGARTELAVRLKERNGTSLGILGYALLDVIDRGVASIAKSMVPKISRMCRQTQSITHAMMNES